MKAEDSRCLVNVVPIDNPRDRRRNVNLWISILIYVVVFFAGFGIGFLARGGCGREDGSNAGSASRRLQSKVDPGFLEQQLRLYASKVHQPGSEQNLLLAETMVNNWRSWGLKSSKLFKYDVNETVANYSNHSIVRLLFKGKTIVNFPTVELNGSLFRYHSYSSSGQSRGRFVFINYGLIKDLETLRNLNVSFCNNTTIAIVRLGFSFRAAKIKNLVTFCGNALPSGLLVYPDPWDYAVDSNNKSSNPENTKVYPDSWWLPGDAAVFGNMKMKSGLQSPSLPSLDGIFNTVNISVFLTPFPVQPISYNDAKILFSFMGGMKIPLTWKNCLPTYIESKENYEIEMMIKNEMANRTMVNVIGNIPGSVERDRYVILGNHRDAWAFGASDPGSGTIILQQVVKIFADAYKTGVFRPRRTVIFANWDGEEEGLLGSTEFTNHFASELGQRCIAYVNMDCPIKGSWSFVGRSTPLLIEPLLDSSKNVFISSGYTLFDDWKMKNPQSPDNVEPRVSSLGGGSDHDLFAYVLGIPSSYPEYTYNQSLPSMPAYHTKYDNIDMMLKFVDRDLKHHALLSKFVIDYIIRLSYAPIIPYGVHRLTEMLLQKFPALSRKLNSIAFINESKHTEIIHRQLILFNASATNFMAGVKSKDKELREDPVKMRAVNDVLLQLPRMFISEEGLPMRPYLKNILLSTTLMNSYLGSVFSGVHDAVDLYKLGKVKLAVVLRQLSLLSNSLRQSIDLLKNSLVDIPY